MLAAGRSNQASARELVVTLDTFKGHVGHALGELGAARPNETGDAEDLAAGDGE